MTGKQRKRHSPEEIVKKLRDEFVRFSLPEIFCSHRLGNGATSSSLHQVKSPVLPYGSPRQGYVLPRVHPSRDVVRGHAKQKRNYPVECSVVCGSGLGIEFSGTRQNCCTCAERADVSRFLVYDLHILEHRGKRFRTARVEQVPYAEIAGDHEHVDPQGRERHPESSRARHAGRSNF